MGDQFNETAPQSGVLAGILDNLPATLKRWVHTHEELLDYLTGKDFEDYIIKDDNEARINREVQLPRWIGRLSASELDTLDSVLTTWVESADERREHAYAYASVS